jgi:hypothetical protein
MEDWKMKKDSIPFDGAMKMMAKEGKRETK